MYSVLQIVYCSFNKSITSNFTPAVKLIFLVRSWTPKRISRKIYVIASMTLSIDPIYVEVSSMQVFN